MLKRRPFKERTLQDRLAAWARKVREQAETMKPGPQKEALLHKVSQAESAAQIDYWISSPGLHLPPRVIEAGRVIGEAKRRAVKGRAKGQV